MMLRRLARMSAAEITGELFTRYVRLDRFARGAFGTIQEAPIAVVLRFAPCVAEDMAECVVPRPDCERNDDGAMTLRFVVWIDDRRAFAGVGLYENVRCSSRPPWRGS